MDEALGVSMMWGDKKVFLIISVIVFLVGSEQAFCDDVFSFLKKKNLQFPYLKGFYIENEAKQHGMYMVHAMKNDIKVRIKIFEGIELEDFAWHEQTNYRVIENLFTFLPSPYPGFISSSRSPSSKQLRPFYKELDICHTKKRVLVLYANANLNYVVKDKNQIQYRCIVFWLYNKEKKIGYNIKLFIPYNKYIEKLISEIFSNVCFL